jgi:hypothetical protein
VERFPKCQVACNIDSRTIQPIEEINGLPFRYAFQSSYQKTNIALNSAVLFPDRFVTETRVHFLSESCMLFIARIAEYSMSAIRKWDEMFFGGSYKYLSMRFHECSTTHWERLERSVGSCEEVCKCVYWLGATLTGPNFSRNSANLYTLVPWRT